MSRHLETKTESEPVFIVLSSAAALEDSPAEVETEAEDASRNESAA